MDGMNEKQEKIFTAALERFDNAVAFEKENRELAEEDHSFANGDGQWEDHVKEARIKQRRPYLTINRLPQYIAQVVGDARQNKPSVKVSPVDDDSDKDMAELLEGIIRHIESDSSASVAYMTAFEHCCTGGFGHWRITTDYCHDKSFDQDIKIERIPNPFSVYWDTASVKVDKSDANWCFISEKIPTEEYKRRFPKEVIHADFSGDDVQHRGNWTDSKDDMVRIAEYWVKEFTDKTISLMPDGKVVDGKVEGATKTRKAQDIKVVRYTLSGDGILIDKEQWSGQYIPVVSIYGPEELAGESIRYRSLIRHAKDAVRMYNFWQTAITEEIASHPRQPYIGTVAQFTGHEKQWADSNNTNRTFLTYNADPLAPAGPQRSQPAGINSAMIQQSMQSIDDIKSTIGMHDASMGAQGNETSGKAILARQREGDTGTFAWIDNLSRGIEQTGRILIDLIPKIYDGERVTRLLGEDDSERLAKLNEDAVNDGTEGWEFYRRNDMSVGKYDVRVAVGPSFNTKRQEAAESMMQFVSAMPQASVVIGDLVAKNMDWPGADLIAERLKKTLPPGMAEESKDLTEEEAAQQQQMMQLAQQEESEGKQMMKQGITLDLQLKEADLQLKQTQIQKENASIGEIQARTVKITEEAQAQGIENDATESGISEVIEGLAAMPQESRAES
tara:strand:- start:2191 stop:4209 length:2019 start_codon:yes stop_codon:yes gene_type:complete